MARHRSDLAPPPEMRPLAGRAPVAAIRSSVDHQSPGAIDLACALIDELLGQAGLDLERIVGVGVAVSAPILRDAAGAAQILPGWAAFAPVDELQRRLGRRVLMDNDANLGALAEVRHGAGQGAVDVLYLMLSSGIGAGLIVDGHLARGRHGITGEIGHIVVDPNGAICRCGNRGCLETIAAAPALLATLAPLRGGAVTLDELVALAGAGDEGCRRLIADAGHAVGQIAGAICNVLNPELVIVGGELIVAGDVLVDAVRVGVHRAVMPAIRGDAQIVAATLGDRAEVLGAVGLVLAETSTTTVLGEHRLTQIRRAERIRVRPVLALDHGVAALDQLDAVAVGVAHEAQARAALAHGVGRLLGLDALPGQAGQRRVEVVDGDRDVVVAGAQLVGVDAEVVGQLQARAVAGQPHEDVDGLVADRHASQLLEAERLVEGDRAVDVADAIARMDQGHAWQSIGHDRGEEHASGLPVQHVPRRRWGGRDGLLRRTRVVRSRR